MGRLLNGLKVKVDSKENEEYKKKLEGAKKRIEEIKELVQSIKDNGGIPPLNLVNEAYQLAQQFPELNTTAEKIKDLREKAIQEVAKTTGISVPDLRAFEELLEKEPLKAISQYIESRKENIDTITAIMNGEQVSPEKERNAILNALSPEEQYKLGAINQRGGLILEEMRQKGEISSERTRLERDLEDGIKLKLHERVVEKHKAQRERDGLPTDHITIAREDGSSIGRDVHHVNNIINQSIEGGIKRLGALFTHKAGHKALDEFIDHKDASRLRTQIEEAERRNAAVVAEKLAREQAEKARKEAAGPENQVTYLQKQDAKVNDFAARKAARQAAQIGRR